MELWKKVNGFDHYWISSYGRVWSTYGKGKFLKIQKCNNGYYGVSLKGNGLHKLIGVHRLVAEHFIPNPEGLPQVNHKDENKMNNSLDNLEWCSAKYNMNYGTANSRRSKSLTNHPLKSISLYQIDFSGNTIKEYPSIIEASRETGISRTGIGRCLKGERKTAGGYKWITK